MADVEIVRGGSPNGEDAYVLACPTDIGELRKATEGMQIHAPREGHPKQYDDDIRVTVEDGAIVLADQWPR